MRQACHRRDQAFGVSLGYPGLQEWQGAVQSGVEQLSYASVDCPEILDEWFEMRMESGTRELELALSVKPDYLLFGGSGTLTLSGPELTMKYAIPALAKWTRLAKQAGVPTMLHSCGRSRLLVDMLVEHTDLNCVNPLEIPPMGDCDLAELKQARRPADRPHGQPAHHRRDAPRQRRRTSAQMATRPSTTPATGGGFILSTGDQCGRDTPEANLVALVQTAKELGHYDENGDLPLLPADARQ